MKNAVPVRGRAAVCAFLFTIVSVIGCHSALWGQVAITEFINDVSGDENTQEWVELFNYSESTVDLTGWRLVDDGANNGTWSGFSLASGAFAILADDKAAFEALWFGGVAQANVFEVGTLALANTADELVLLDDTDTEVWRVAYADDETAGRATFLSEDNFAFSDYGSEASPGVVRDGVDNTGLLGYQSNDVTADAFAFTAGGDTGSPLLGGYSVVPEPEAVALALGLLALGLCVLRRRC